MEASWLYEIYQQKFFELSILQYSSFFILKKVSDFPFVHFKVILLWNQKDLKLPLVILTWGAILVNLQITNITKSQNI